MFLSDKLIAIGKEANLRNNASQAKQCEKMLNELIVAKNKGEDQKRLINIMKFVIKQLNHDGFLYYNLDIFFTKITNTN